MTKRMKRTITGHEKPNKELLINNNNCVAAVHCSILSMV